MPPTQASGLENPQTIDPLQANGLELNLAVLNSEALRRLVLEVADVDASDSFRGNYDRVHNRHNR